MSYKIKRFAIPAIIALCVILIFLPDFFRNKGTEESYKFFYNQVESESIEKAEISDKYIFYQKKDSTEKFYTVNPNSPLLTEFLAKNGVSIKIEKNSLEIFNTITDILFYLIFFGGLFFAWNKFIRPQGFKVQHKTNKTFNDIVGMDSVKNDLCQIMKVMKNPVEWAKKGIRLPKGILLEGEPGNGKTLFAKALAGEAKVNFIPARATDFESMFMAIGPMKIKLLFSKARKLAPCIIFIDEFDGIGTRRNYSGSAIETENTRIVTALLNELDGFSPSNGILVIAATNNAKALDEALIRPGRFDAHYVIPYPEEDDRIKLVELYTKNKKLDQKLTAESLAKKFKGFSCAKIESVLNRACLYANQRGDNTINLQDIEKSL